MTIRVRYRVTCNGADIAFSRELGNRNQIMRDCTYEAPMDIDADAARRRARQAGWTTRGRADLCPACTEALAGVE